MKIDAGSKVKTARTWLCFQRPCAIVVSGDLRVTIRCLRANARLSDLLYSVLCACIKKLCRYVTTTTSATNNVNIFAFEVFTSSTNYGLNFQSRLDENA